MQGTEKLMGFYTTRFVEAASATDAEALALRALEDEYEFSDEQKRLAPDAKVYFEEVIEVDSDTPRIPNKGATWFPMEEN